MVNSSIAVAKDNTIRVSPLKLGNITRLIVNLKASKAINQLKFSQKRISMHVLKVLNAAIANAENNKQLDIDNLFVREAYVGKGLSMKRFRPRAKGRASSIVKPFSKLTIVLEERKNSKSGIKNIQKRYSYFTDKEVQVFQNQDPAEQGQFLPD